MQRPIAMLRPGHGKKIALRFRSYADIGYTDLKKARFELRLKIFYSLTYSVTINGGKRKWQNGLKFTSVKHAVTLLK